QRPDVLSHREELHDARLLCHGDRLQGTEQRRPRTRHLRLPSSAASRMISYPDSVRYLYSLGNEIKAAKFGLETIRAVLAALGDPQRDPRFVHVAGTNGKGSVCAMVESALRAAGRRTGLYTSPHLVEPVERVRIDGVAVTADEFARAFDVVHETSERLLAEGAIQNHPTYFETVTAMGFLLFRGRGVEDVVLEVGLGGGLD